MNWMRLIAIFCLVVGTTVAVANPITIYVGYAAGGLADRLSRLAASELSKELKQPVNVRNLTGANGLRAAKETLQHGENEIHLLFADSSLFIAHELAKQQDVDPWRFLPVGSFGVTPFALVVPNNLPVVSTHDLIRYLNEHPEKASFGSPGMYSVHQLGVTFLLKKAKASAQHIPYQGGVQMLNDLLTSRLTFGVLSVHLADQYVQSGDLRVVSVTGRKRIGMWPETPTISDSFPGVQAVSSAYLLASPKTPPVLHDKIVKAWSKIIGQRHLIQQLESFGMEGPPVTSQDLQKLMRSEQHFLINMLRQLN